jgi:outer membrane lipoprotein-sorting protein
MMHRPRRYGWSVSLAALAAGMLMVAASSASAQTVDDLVAKNIEAKGGLEKLHAVQTVKQTSTLDMRGMQASIVVYGKRPNLLRQEVKLGDRTIINAFDGTTPWMINPLAGTDRPVVITGPQADMIRDQSSFDGPLVDYKDKGSKVELVGRETVEGRAYDHLKITDKDGQVQDVYLDGATGLEARLVTTSAAGTFEQDLSDYRDVDGIKVPFAIRTLVNGVEQSRITVQSVAFNVDVDAGMFAVPR